MKKTDSNRYQFKYKNNYYFSIRLNYLHSNSYYSFASIMPNSYSNSSMLSHGLVKNSPVL